jgi:hypothetical protein
MVGQAGNRPECSAFSGLHNVVFQQTTAVRTQIPDSHFVLHLQKDDDRSRSCMFLERPLK